MTTDERDAATKTIPRGQAASRETILERQRMRRVTGLKPYAALGSVFLGFLPIIGEFYRYYRFDHALNAWAILLGGTFMVVGAYMLNHTDTKDLVSFLVTNGIAVAGAIPSGIAGAIRTVRSGRANDPPGTVVETTITPPASEPEETHPTHEV